MDDDLLRGRRRRWRGILIGLWFILVTGGAGCSRQPPPGRMVADLESRARMALGEREGAVLAIDPRTGELLAVVNPRLAFEQSFPPGSTIKPFTALAALRAGRVPADWTHRCTGGRRDEAGNLLCTHPRLDQPLTLPQALAWSCNDYFLTLGERLGRRALNDYLLEAGFGARTGVNAVEKAGRLPGELAADLAIDLAADQEDPRPAIGEGGELLVTPIQLLRGYQGIVNGGHFCRPFRSGRQGREEGRCRDSVWRDVPTAHRRLVLAGMRGAVTYGTAAVPEFAGSPGQRYLIAKTGTSAASNGFRRQGWFVGFVASFPGAAGFNPEEPEDMDLGLLVFLRRGSGGEAARIAGAILNPEATATPVADREPGPVTSVDGLRVRVRGEVRTVPLEEYLAGVLLAETGLEREREALRAQAVISRTFALGNPGRHRREGYDFCTTTHCQRYVPVAAVAVERRSLVATAVAATAGELLRDPAGGVAEVYYHAACGGRTASIAEVWPGSRGAQWLRGVADPLCAGRRARAWEDRLSIEQIERALRADPQTRSIGRLREIGIAATTADGRAMTISLQGDRRRSIPAWDFKLIIGRTLGWQRLKSTRFDIDRDGRDYLFRGRGFGHGIGLCQDGAHDLARRGAGYRRILDHYFPGTVLDTRWSGTGRAGVPRMFAAGLLPLAQRGDGRVRWVLPSGAVPAGFDAARRIIDDARRELATRLGEELNLSMEIHAHATTADFIRATGLSGWVAGVTRGARIDLQPLAQLERRRILASTLRHELVHATLEQLRRRGGADRPIPRWLTEGLAIHFAGEGPALVRQAGRLAPLERAELERRLAGPLTPRESRILYARAWREVRELIAAQGERSVWQLAINAPPRLL